MSERPNLIAVAGQQRSGTTVLRYLLATLPGTFELGEIFSGHVSIPTNFWGYLNRLAIENPALVCPHFWYDVWERYIVDMQREVARDRMVFDLKADHMPFCFHHSPFVDGERTGEFIFSWHNLKVVVVERRNTLAQIVSRMIMEATGISGTHNFSSDPRHFRNLARAGDPSTEKLLEAARMVRARLETQPQHTLDPHVLEREVRAMQVANRFVRQATKPLQPLLLYYENLFDEAGMFSDDTVVRLAEYIGVRPEDFDRVPLAAKMSGACFLDQLENRREIVNHFDKTDLAWMVHACLSA